MQFIVLFIVALVAVEHLGIAFLEMFGSPEKQAQAFDMPLDYVKIKESQVALSNQGIYNGMLGIAILAMILFLTGYALKVTLIIMMAYIVIVAIYGFFTATKKILYLQGLPALIAGILVLFFYA
jgi:Predicted membrane protein